MVTFFRVVVVAVALLLAFSFAKQGVLAGMEAAKAALAAHDEESEQAPAAAASEGKAGLVILEEWQYGCSDRGLYEKIMNFAKGDNLGAFYGFLASAEEAEGCEVFVSGEEVYFSGQNEPSDFVKIRRKAENEEYWTSRQEVWKSMENIWR